MVVGMRVFLILALIAITLAEDQLENERKKKVFSLFSVVTFPNDQCTAKSSTTATPVLGTCLSQTECSGKSGTVDGNCASGFGVCCTFLVSTCGSTVSENCTYVQNPSYPSSYTTAGSCEYTVTPLSADICQLRLDFDNLDITETTAGACTDSFAVTSGSSRVYPTLCGTLTGQHMYMETARKTSDQKVSFTIATTSTVATWRIKISQIECFSIAKADADCFQWFTGVSGEVKSLNYPTVALDDVVYTVCVRREAGFCGIQWSEAASPSPDSFILDGTLTVGESLNTLSSGAYINIPGSGFTSYGGLALVDDFQAIAADKDTTAGAAVTTTGATFTLGFTTVTAASAITGFDLVYQQVPCA